MLEYIVLKPCNVECFPFSVIKESELEGGFQYVFPGRIIKKKITKDLINTMHIIHERKTSNSAYSGFWDPILFIKHFNTDVEAFDYIRKLLESEIEEIYRYRIKDD